MCFKTASLPAPSTKTAEEFVVASTNGEIGDAHYYVTATDTREVFVAFEDHRGGPLYDVDGQYFDPNGLRAFAIQLLQLADKIAA